MGQYLDQYREARKQQRALNKLNLDTFYADLTTADEELNKYLTGGWQDSAAADTQRQSINALLSRIQNTKAYMEKYADSYDKSTYDSYMADLDAVEKSLNEGAGYINEAALIYSKYQNADLYNAAKVNSDRFNKVAEKYKGYTGDQLMTEADRIRRENNRLSGVPTAQALGNEPMHTYEGNEFASSDIAFERADDIETLALLNANFTDKDLDLVYNHISGLDTASRHKTVQGLIEAKALEKWAVQEAAHGASDESRVDPDWWQEALAWLVGSTANLLRLTPQTMGAANVAGQGAAGAALSKDEARKIIEGNEIKANLAYATDRKSVV